MKHTTHPDILKRLKQANGQLSATLAMFAEGRSCAELAQQLQAVESVIHSTKRMLIQDHMEHCIGEGLVGGEMNASQALAEFRALSKYL